MPTRNVNLTEHDDQFIDAGVAAGRFTDASEAIRAGLHLLEREEWDEKAKIEWLRNAAQAGIDSLDRGEGIAFHSMDELAEHIRGIGRDVRALNVRKHLGADLRHSE